MKKILLIFFIFIMTTYPSFSIEDDFIEDEIKLEDNINIDKKESVFENFEEKKFKLGAEKFFSDRKRLKFEDSFLNEVSGEIRYQGVYSFESTEEDKSSQYPFLINTLVETKFDKNKYRFLAEYAFTRDASTYDSEFWGKFSNLYLEGKINENNKFKIGSHLAPIGVEGGLSGFYVPFYKRGQISRKFSSATATGISFLGENDIFDYNIGAYTTTRNNQGFKDGAEFIGRVGVKPFNKTDIETIKDLKFYGGIDTGHRGENYEVYNGAIYYKYKKFGANIEYAYANGSNRSSYNDKRRQGYFATLSYKLTENVEVLARYDMFDNDVKKRGDNRFEYTIGLNWAIFKERLRLAINYVFVDDKREKKKANRVYFLTQIFI